MYRVNSNDSWHGDRTVVFVKLCTDDMCNQNHVKLINLAGFLVNARNELFG